MWARVQLRDEYDNLTPQLVNVLQDLISIILPMDELSKSHLIGATKVI